MRIIKGDLCKVPEENFEMVSYTFIRYENDISVNEKNKILLQVEFPERKEGIAVLNYDLEKENDGELKNFFNAEKVVYTKTLWIAKGSFCEN